MQKEQRARDDARRSRDDLPREFFVQKQNSEHDHQRYTQLINRSDLGDIAALQRLEVEQPRDAGGESLCHEKRDGLPRQLADMARAAAYQRDAPCQHQNDCSPNRRGEV